MSLSRKVAIIRLLSSHSTMGVWPNFSCREVKSSNFSSSTKYNPRFQEFLSASYTETACMNSLHLYRLMTKKEKEKRIWKFWEMFHSENPSTFVECSKIVSINPTSLLPFSFMVGCGEMSDFCADQDRSGFKREKSKGLDVRELCSF